MTAHYPGSMLDDELEELTETVREAIAYRGFYILTDDRLDLLCGFGCGEKVGQPEVNQLIDGFAARHGWTPRLVEDGYEFRSPSSKGAGRATAVRSGAPA